MLLLLKKVSKIHTDSDGVLVEVASIATNLLQLFFFYLVQVLMHFVAKDLKEQIFCKSLHKMLSFTWIT